VVPQPKLAGVLKGMNWQFYQWLISPDLTWLALPYDGNRCHNDVGLTNGLCGANQKGSGTKEAEMKIVGCDLHARQ
jgi:hypothetical protein